MAPKKKKTKKRKPKPKMNDKSEKMKIKQQKRFNAIAAFLRKINPKTGKKYLIKDLENKDQKFRRARIKEGFVVTDDFSGGGGLKGGGGVMGKPIIKGRDKTTEQKGLISVEDNKELVLLRRRAAERHLEILRIDDAKDEANIYIKHIEKFINDLHERGKINDNEMFRLLDRYVFREFSRVELNLIKKKRNKKKQDTLVTLNDVINQRAPNRVAKPLRKVIGKFLFEDFSEGKGNSRVNNEDEGDGGGGDGGPRFNQEFDNEEFEDSAEAGFFGGGLDDSNDSYFPDSQSEGDGGGYGLLGGGGKQSRPRPYPTDATISNDGERHLESLRKLMVAGYGGSNELFKNDGPYYDGLKYVFLKKNVQGTKHRLPITHMHISKEPHKVAIERFIEKLTEDRLISLDEMDRLRGIYLGQITPEETDEYRQDILLNAGVPLIRGDTDGKTNRPPLPTDLLRNVGEFLFTRGEGKGPNRFNQDDEGDGGGGAQSDSGGQEGEFRNDDRQPPPRETKGNRPERKTFDIQKEIRVWQGRVARILIEFDNGLIISTTAEDKLRRVAEALGNRGDALLREGRINTTQYDLLVRHGEQFDRDNIPDEIFEIEASKTLDFFEGGGLLGGAAPGKPKPPNKRKRRERAGMRDRKERKGPPRTTNEDGDGGSGRTPVLRDRPIPTGGGISLDFGPEPFPRSEIPKRKQTQKTPVLEDRPAPRVTFDVPEAPEPFPRSRRETDPLQPSRSLPKITREPVVPPVSEGFRDTGVNFNPAERKELKELENNMVTAVGDAEFDFMMGNIRDFGFGQGMDILIAGILLGLLPMNSELNTDIVKGSIGAFGNNAVWGILPALAAAIGIQGELWTPYETQQESASASRQQPGASDEKINIGDIKSLTAKEYHNMDDDEKIAMINRLGGRPIIEPPTYLDFLSLLKHVLGGKGGPTPSQSPDEPDEPEPAEPDEPDDDGTDPAELLRLLRNAGYTPEQIIKFFKEYFHGKEDVIIPERPGGSPRASPETEPSTDIPQETAEQPPEPPDETPGEIPQAPIENQTPLPQSSTQSTAQYVNDPQVLNKVMDLRPELRVGTPLAVRESREQSLRDLYEWNNWDRALFHRPNSHNNPLWRGVLEEQNRRFTNTNALPVANYPTPMYTPYRQLHQPQISDNYAIGRGGSSVSNFAPIISEDIDTQDNYRGFMDSINERGTFQTIVA